MSFVSNHQPEVIDEMNSQDEAPVRVRKPRAKPERRVRLAVALNAAGQNGLVVITVGKNVEAYYLNRAHADWGMGFSVEMIGGTDGPYHVHLDGDNKTCDCKGHSRHNHCKHADGLAKLIQAGKLAPATNIPVAVVAA